MELTRYINMFDTATAYTAAVENEELNYPNLSYVEETGAIHLDATAPTPTHDYSQDYFALNFTEAGTFKLTSNPIDYSTNDGATWTTLASNTVSPTIPAGTKVKVKRVHGLVSLGRFVVTGQFTVEGNAMSLVYGDNFTGQTSLSGYNIYDGLFQDCTGLTSAENLVLPATTLTNHDYDSMFKGCTNLTIAPVLPATTVGTGCYMEMFKGCTSLTTAPDLLATVVGFGAYYQMFQGCTSLNYIKMLGNDFSAGNCLHNWVDGVAATGTFVKSSAATIAEGVNGIPAGWTVEEV